MTSGGQGAGTGQIYTSLSVGRSTGSWVLRSCRNTATTFRDSNRGSRIQSQCLVMPEVLEQPGKPPEQSTCCIDGLVQFFDLVDPDFAFLCVGGVGQGQEVFPCPQEKRFSLRCCGCWVPALPSPSTHSCYLLGWECSGGQAALTAPALGETGSQP